MRDPKDRFQGWSRDKPAEINISNVELFLQKIMADAFGGVQPSFNAANKFRLAESVAKFTGIRIPDLKMEQIKDVSSLRAALVRKQKEARFSEVFGKNQNSEVRDLPNVSISDRRVTMFDKENERGRWKIIEKALRQRGLPVFKKEANRNKRLL
ncbi:Cell division control protein 15 [Elsinoe australis]|uniref:Large ribosomal subunit protein mL50 n=1 Tax=Elsinoe australis TaxID=40998 RepID=A0A2P8AE38_9PEZI|nr:Cell division control protein 15 [Elsinoe australis]